jgi:hypothetical protein
LIHSSGKPCFSSDVFPRKIFPTKIVCRWKRLTAECLPREKKDWSVSRSMARRHFPDEKIRPGGGIWGRYCSRTRGGRACTAFSFSGPPSPLLGTDSRMKRKDVKSKSVSGWGRPAPRSTFRLLLCRHHSTKQEIFSAQFSLGGEITLAEREMAALRLSKPALSRDTGLAVRS